MDNNTFCSQIDYSYYKGMAVSYYQRMAGQYDLFNDIRTELCSASSHMSRCNDLREAYSSFSGSDVFSVISSVQEIISTNMCMLNSYLSGI